MMDRIEVAKRRSFQEICEFIAQARSKGESIALTSGCFDVLHVGHVIFLEECAEGADHLVVGVDDNETVNAAKGEDHPFFDETERMKVLDALRFVTLTFSFRGPMNAALLKQLAPNHYCFSPYDPKREQKTAEALAAGSQPKFAGISIKSWSSSRVGRLLRYQFMVEPWVISQR